MLDSGNALIVPASHEGTRAGQVMIEAMNMMAYDAMAIGAYDTEIGAAALRERIAEASFPLLSANLTVEATGALLARPYVLLPMAGHTVAIIGLTAEALPQGPATTQERLIATDPMTAALAYVAEVESRADIIILLSNAGMTVNRLIAEEIPAIDVIVSGGTRGLSTPQRLENGMAVIAEAGFRGEWLGRMALDLNAAGQVSAFGGETIELTDVYPDDPAMRRFVDRVKSGS